MRLVPRISALNPVPVLLGLNPIPLLLGPIYSKEMAVSGRRWSTYILRTSVCFMLLLITSLAFLQQGTSSFTTAGWGAVQSTQVAVTLTYTIGIAQIFISAFIGVVSSAAAISEERTNRTIASLASTPLTNAQIVFGKFTSRLAELILLNLLPVPLLLLIRVFGGIEPELIIVFTFSAICMGVLGSATSIFISSWIGRPFGVIFLAGFALLLFEALPTILLVFIGFVTQSSPDRAMEILAYASIPVALFYTQAGAIFSGAQPGYTPLIVAGATHIVAAITLNIFTAIILRAIISSGATKNWAATTRRRSKRRSQPQAQSGRAPKPASTPSNKRRKARKRSRHISDHPVLWRESRQIMGGSQTTKIVGISIFAAVMLYVYISALVSDVMGDLHLVIAYLFGIILLFISIFAPAALIAGERDARTWDALLTTPLSIRSILWQKLLGTTLRPMTLVGALCLHFILFSGPWMPYDARANSVVMIAGILLVLPPWSVAYCGTGILCSTVMKGSRTAATANFIFAISLCIFVPMIFNVVRGTLIDYTLLEELPWIESVVVGCNPVMLFAGVLEAAIDGWPVSSITPINTYNRPGFFTLLASSAAAAFVLAVLALEIARARIMRTSGRTN